jgi:hypothetical protein
MGCYQWSDILHIQFCVPSEVIRLEKEIVISEIVFEMIHGQPYKGFQKLP